MHHWAEKWEGDLGKGWRVRLDDGRVIILEHQQLTLVPQIPSCWENNRRRSIQHQFRRNQQQISHGALISLRSLSVSLWWERTQGAFSYSLGHLQKSAGVLLQSNPCTAIKSAAASPFPLPQQLFHLLSSPSVSAFQSLAAGVRLLSQHWSASLSLKLKQLLPFDSCFLSHSVPCCSCWSLLYIPGPQELIATSPGGKELINHSQFCVPSSKQPQDLHPPGLRSLFLRQLIIRSIAALFDHQSPSDCTNHQFHPTFICYDAKKHLPLFGFLSLFPFCFSLSVLFLGALFCFSLFHTAQYFTEGSNQATEFTTFPLFSRGHLFFGKLSAPVAVVPKKLENYKYREIKSFFLI